MVVRISLPKKGYQILYLLILFFYNFYFILSSSLLDFGDFDSYVRYIVFASLCILLLFKFITTKEYISKCIIYIVIAIVFFVAGLKTDRLYLIIYALFILDSDIVEFREIAKTSIISSIFALFCIYVLCLMGVINDYIYARGDVGAHCFGFSYYGSVPYYLFYVFVIYLYLRRKKISWIEIAIWGMLNYYLYKLCTVRLTFYLSIITLVFYVVFVKYELLNISKKFIIFITKFVFGGSILVIYYTMVKYDVRVSLWYKLNEILSGRLKYVNDAYNQYGIKLWGQYIKMNGHSVFEKSRYGHFYIDSGFAYSLLGYGLIFTVVVVLLYTSIYTKSCKNNDKMMFVWVTVVLIFSFINNTWVALEYNPILFYAVNEMNKNTKKNKMRRMNEIEKEKNE